MKGFTSILSSPKVSVGDPFLLKKENDRFPTATLGNDNNNNDRSRNPAGRPTLRDDGLTTSGRTAGALVKRLVVVFMGLFSAVNAPAEIISAVSYNPSRMGDYVYLKVADKANLKGGIESNTMIVRSGGTVTATSPDLNYDVPAVVGASGSTLDMPNTAIHGSNANTYNNYQAVNTGTPSALLGNVNVNGGQTTVKNDSYISTLDAVNRLKQKAATLRANKLSVSGSEDASLYDGATTDGFTLAGNDIPQPTSSHVNTGAALSNCTLKWEERTTSDNQKVKLLALANCGAGDTNNCTPTRSGKEEYTVTCPGDTNNSRLYRWNYSTCKYDLITECPKKQYTCLTGAVWKTKRVGGSGLGSCSSWVHKYWDGNMTCGSETVNTKGPINCKAGQECNCTVGEQRLYILTYKCADSGTSASSNYLGYYCVTCGTTDNLSNCVGPTGPGAGGGFVDIIERN